MIALVFGSPFIYDALYKTVLKDPTVGFVGGLVLSAVMLFLMAVVAHFTFRAYAIHLGAMFGTIMAFNVWFRIWPAQQQIIRATKDGQAPGRRAGGAGGHALEAQHLHVGAAGLPDARAARGVERQLDHLGCGGADRLGRGLLAVREVKDGERVLRLGMAR